jgi:uncharacterized protein (TIGR02147 family)
MTQHDSTTYLKEAFADSVRTNPRYSLRAFAKKLGLSPGGLSQILARKKHLSVTRAHGIAKSLGLDAKETERFLLLVQIEGTKNIALKSELYERLQKFSSPEQPPAHNLTIDQFRLISDWFGPATCEYLTGISGKATAADIANRLNITRAEADAVIERLIRLEMIEKTETGEYKAVAERHRIESAVPSEAIRNYYESVIDRVRDSVKTQSPQEKVIAADVFAFDPSQLDEVRKLTDGYLGKLQALAKNGKNRTEVYQAFTDVFRLTNPAEKPKTQNQTKEPIRRK